MLSSNVYANCLRQVQQFLTIERIPDQPYYSSVLKSYLWYFKCWRQDTYLFGKTSIRNVEGGHDVMGQNL